MIIRVPKQHVELSRQTRPPEYWVDVNACEAFKFFADGSATIDDSRPCYAALLKKWRNPSKPKKVAPGDLAEWLVKQAGFGLCPITCKQFQAKMNQNGWLWCIKNRQEIIDWFVAQAKKRKIDISSEDAIGLFKAGVLQIWKQTRK